MAIFRGLARTTWLWVAILLAGCASRVGSGREETHGWDESDWAVGRTAVAAAQFQDLSRQPYDEQRRRLDIVLAKDPGDLGARFLRTQADFRLADSPAVVADSALALANPALGRRLRRAVLDWRAEALLQIRRHGEALVAADEALALDGSDAKALASRGWARFLSDEKGAASALADLDRAVQLEPEEGVGYYRRAVVLRSQDQRDRAAEDFQRALQFVPDDVDTRYAYGLLLLDMKEPVHALVQFDAAVSLSPRAPALWAWRAQVDVWLKHYDDASGDAERAIALGASGEDLAAARGALAAAFNDRLDFAAAAREYRAALAIEDDLNTRRGLLRSLWYAGQFRQATELFRQQTVPPTTADYTPLWLFVMRGRADPRDEDAAKAELAAAAPPHQPHVWSDTLVDLMLGRTTLETALAEADASPDNKLKAGGRCEVDYYAAEHLLMHGQDEAANRLLEEAYWVCPATYYEAKAIIGERRLQEAKSSRH